MKIHRYYQKNTLAHLAIRAYIRVFKISGHPRKIALGFAFGVLVGMSPTMGVQMAIAAFLASLLGWNPISAAMGVWITTPVTAPVIYSLTYLAGAKVLRLLTDLYFPPRLYLRDITKILYASPKIFLALIVGGILLGVPLAVLSYYLSYFMIQQYRTRLKGRIAARVSILRLKRLHRSSSQEELPSSQECRHDQENLLAAPRYRERVADSE